MKKLVFALVVIALLLSACAPPDPVIIVVTATAEPTAPVVIEPTATLQPTYGGHTKAWCDAAWGMLEDEMGEEMSSEMKMLAVMMLSNQDWATGSVSQTLKECINGGWTGWAGWR